MGKLEVSKELKGDFGELCFKHFCLKNHFAYIKLEDIYKSFTPKDMLTFKYGFYRIPVAIPHDVGEEIRLICRPSNSKEFQPSFVLDYLTVALNSDFVFDDQMKTYRQTTPMPYLSWVEVKYGTSQLTKNQEAIKKIKTKIPVRVFRVLGKIPDEIEVRDDDFHEINELIKKLTQKGTNSW